MEHSKLYESVQEHSIETIQKLHQQKRLKYIQHIPLDKSFNTIYLAGKDLDNEKICQMTFLNMEQIKEVLSCRKHILNLYKYVPDSHIYMTPNKLKSVSAVVEMLNELMFRLSRVGAKMTDDEWISNAKMLKNYFNVEHMQINENWVTFFRTHFNHTSQFEQCSQMRNKIKFDIKTILQSIEYMLDPIVVASFESYLGNKKINFKCKDLYGFVKDNSLNKSINASENKKKTHCDDLNENECYEVIEFDETNFDEEICEVADSDVDIDLNDEPVSVAQPMRNETTNETLNINKKIGQKNSPTKVIQEQTDWEPKIDVFVIASANNENSNDIIEIFDDDDEIEDENDKLKNKPVKIVTHESEYCTYSIRAEIEESAADIEIDEHEQMGESSLLTELKGNSETKMQSYITQECINTEELNIIDIIKEEPCVSGYNEIINENSEESVMSINSISSIEASVEKNTIAKTKDTPEYDIKLANTKIAEIASIFHHTSTPLEIDLLTRDPIISYYMQLSLNTNKPTGTLPRFDEKKLRLSFATVLGKRLQHWTQPIRMRPEDIDLYRILVMLVYSLGYKSMKDLKAIMSPFCLQIHKILSYSQERLEEWRIFFNQQFIYPLYKKAFYDMLYEYSRRSLIITGTVNDQEFLLKSKEIQLFLGCKLSLNKNWKREYSDYIKYIYKSKKFFKYRKFTNKDLHLLSIYNDIKDDLDDIIDVGVKQIHSIYTYRKSTLKAPNTLTNPIGPMMDLKNKKIDTISPMLQTTAVVESSAGNHVKFSDNPKRSHTILSDSPNKQPNTKSRNEITPELLNKNHEVNSDSSYHQNDCQLEELAEIPISDKTKEMPSDKKSELLAQFSNGNLKMCGNKPNNSMVAVKLSTNPIQKNSILSTSPNENLKRKIQSDITAESIKKTKINSNHQNSFQWRELTKIQIQNETKDIFYDPIIALYLKNSKPNDAKTALPVFSEKRLRQAFDEVVNENHFDLNVNMCKQEELILYRKLLLLHYFQYYEELDQLHSIMRCFSKKIIYTYLNKYKNIIQQWQIFLNNNLSRFLYKEALYELLFEYANRYLRIFKRLSDKSLKRKALEIQKLLGCSLQLPDYWIQEFTALFKNKLWKKIDRSGDLNRNYLDLSSIFEIAKQRFPRFLQDIVICDAEEETKSPTRKIRTEKVKDVEIFEVNVEQLNQPNDITISDTKSPDFNIENPERGIEINIMKELGKDPIISFYMLLTNSKKCVDSALPTFDEVRLQSAFHEVFHHKNIINFNELKLYRKLILFKYSEQFATLGDLAAIMHCFDENSIKEHFENFSNIIEEWHQFVRNRFSTLFSRHAFNEILFEYTARYMRLYGHITDKALIEKAKEVQELLCDACLMNNNWLIKFNSTLLPRLIKTKFDPHIKPTSRYLELSAIYEHIKDQLHFSVWETVNQANVIIGRNNKITVNLNIAADSEYILPDENDEENHSKDIFMQLDSQVDACANEIVTNNIEQYKKYAINVNGLKKGYEITQYDLKKEEENANYIETPEQNVSQLISISNAGNSKMVKVEEKPTEEIEKEMTNNFTVTKLSNIYLSGFNLKKYHAAETVSEKNSETLTQINNSDVITLDHGIHDTDELMIDEENAITFSNVRKRKSQKSFYSKLELPKSAGQSTSTLSYETLRKRFRWMIYYDFQCGLSAMQCINRINVAFGDDAPSSDAINKWYLDLKNYLASQSEFGKK